MEHPGVGATDDERDDGDNDDPDTNTPSAWLSETKTGRARPTKRSIGDAGKSLTPQDAIQDAEAECIHERE